MRWSLQQITNLLPLKQLMVSTKQKIGSNLIDRPEVHSIDIRKTDTPKEVGHILAIAVVRNRDLHSSKGKVLLHDASLCLTGPGTRTG